jgi:peptidyl-prolyl cis-trans isomerase B (cyclophilin B)
LPAASQVHARSTLTLGSIAVLAVLALTGCAGKTPVAPPTGDTAAQEASSTPAESTDIQEGSLYTPTYQPNGSEVAIIKTNKGVIKVKLYGNEAPVNTANFVELAEKGFYDKVKFHRLEPGFVIQGGDPQTAELSSKDVIKLVESQNQGTYEQGQPRLGTGGPGYMIKGEFDPTNVAHKHVDGTLAMARSNDPNSAGSQFYFTLGPQSFLDGQYTVFGDVLEGLPVVHKLEIGDVIESVTVENTTK